MAASMCRFRRANLLRKILWREGNDRVARLSTFNENENKLFTEIDNENKTKAVQRQTSFATLFRQSMFAQMGDYKDKRVYGLIDTVKGDDLYIDFGGKFLCVCPRPKANARAYKKGTEVRLVLHDPEMTSSFLGSDKHLTLLEADCTLLGLKKVKVSKIKPEGIVEEEEDMMEYIMPDPEMTAKLGGQQTENESEPIVDNTLKSQEKEDKPSST